MDKPVLIIMAAGMGSRYGGLKQLDSIGPAGEVILDYSVFDAKKAGFEKVIFVIKEEFENDFEEKIGKNLRNHMEVEYIFQNIENIPDEFTLPEDRVKPWGTAHAILSCIDSINGPFAVINADDYYGRNSFKMLYDFLASEEVKDGKSHHCMIGFRLENTLTDSGHVARGICTTDDNDMLIDIIERTQIQEINDSICFMEDDTWTPIEQDSIASMNCWGFRKELIDVLNERFKVFLRNNIDNLKAEFFLPSVVSALLREQKADVKVLTTDERWFGVTYIEDKENVANSIKELTNKGVYPERLWT